MKNVKTVEKNKISRGGGGTPRQGGGGTPRA